MDVLIVSDTHGRVTRLNELIEYRQKLIQDKEPLKLIYLGDGIEDLFESKYYDSIISHAVRGNCDISSASRMTPFGEEVPFSRLIYVDKYKIFMTHGHNYSVKYGNYDEICREASRQGADIVMFGHTHLPTLEYINKGSIRGVERDLVLFNPGSLGETFDGSFGNLSVNENAFLLTHGKYSNIIKK